MKDNAISQIEEDLKESFPELPDLKVKENCEFRPSHKYYISVDADLLEGEREDGTYGSTELWYRMCDFFHGTELLANLKPGTHYRINDWGKRYAENQDGTPTVRFFFNTEYSAELRKKCYENH